MAQKVLVQLVDDLDGTVAEDVETVSFGLDGVAYSIDLNPANAAQLRDALADFVANARRSGGRAKRPTSIRRTIVAEARTKEQTKAIREWARTSGFELSDRGRIPTNVIEQFENAHR
ncbi:histone-like nucleoid-structuring protein Lsr2 [Lentzea jiangxiensis]|uniref:Lsr2 protein n=1 Tax=Lentzea jiangxiensis TaxID=641025 RepID=A0A1H0X7P8_9PSEU|nr:Lsr2 family protein [Lentzea jiangxiensis]SDP98496.1 Lsr2 protein [Lentzea jiangxiensis]